MAKYEADPVVEAFILNYGIRNLLEDIGARKIHKQHNDFMCCCPFHEESEPSFGMNSKNGLFQCFAGCKSGSLYKFVAEVYNLSYADAEKFIRQRAKFDDDVDIEDLKLKHDIKIALAQNTPEVIQLREIGVSDINRMYEGEDPTFYMQKRGFTNETIEYFEVGYTEHWRNKGEMTKRITFPGHDEMGRVIGFIGRSTENHPKKYLYSYGYPKQYTLFNLHRAKQYAKNGLIVVEGGLDTMQNHNNGYPNTVAQFGASLSDYQAELLCKYTDKVYLMTDNDEAGKNSTKKSLEKLENKLDVYIVPLQEYKDPGEIEGSYNADRIMAGAINVFDFKLKSMFQ